MKKTYIATLLATTMTLSLAACGSNNQSTSTTTAAAGETTKAAETTAGTAETTAAAASDGEQISLRFSWWGGDERLAATLAVIEQFEEKYPNIKIEPEYGGSDGYADKLATQLAAGTEPDIMQIDPSVMTAYITGDTDYFVDFKADGFDFSQFEENYLALRSSGCYSGEQLGIPTGVSGMGLLLNEQLIEQYKDEIGFDFEKPYTWDEMIEWGRKLHEMDDSIYLISSNKEMIQHILMRAYCQQLSGDSYLNDETGELRQGVEEWTQIYNMVKALYDNNVIPPASYMAAYSGDNLNTDPNWIAGKYVGTFCHNSLIGNMKAANTNNTYTAGNLPVMENAVLDGWLANAPQVMSVSKRSPHVAEAELFLDYFFNDATAQETLGCVRSAPATSGGRELAEKNGTLDPVMAKSIEILGQYAAKDDDALSGSNEVQQILRDEIEAIGFGATTPEKAAEETVSLLEDYTKSLDLN